MDGRMARVISWQSAVRRRRRRVLAGIGLAGLGFLFAVAAGVAALRIDWGAVNTQVDTLVASVTQSYGYCHGEGWNCVVDGDTFRHRGVRIRIADIDTPEVRDYRCLAEKALGDRATDRLRELLSAGPFQLRSIDRDEDVYGRKLRIVMRDGRSIGEQLISEGLAQRWSGSKAKWC